jgi:hypothetical protein
MGARGPVPKRSDQRRRRNAPEVPIEQAPAAPGGVEVPPAHDRWHPIARDWYESLARSGQSAFYEPSDWATAVLIAESISRDLKPQVVGVHPETGEPVMAAIPLKGASLAAYLKAMTALLVTEGDRRRAAVELQRVRQDPDAEREAGIAQLADYANRLTG